MSFCPNCRAEYVEGIKTCTDCDVDLVAALPRDEEKNLLTDEELVPVFSAGNRVEADVVIGLLEGIGIHAWFRAGGVWRPGTEIASPVDYGPILVAASDADEARCVIEQALEAGKNDLHESG